MVTLFASGEARLAIALGFLAIALTIFSIRMFCRLIGWLLKREEVEPDGQS